jgi:hypothetical protein
LSRELTDLVIITIVMIVLALYYPLFGALLSLFILWHSIHNGLIGRRNAAIGCTALAIFNLGAHTMM